MVCFEANPGSVILVGETPGPVAVPVAVGTPGLFVDELLAILDAKAGSGVLVLPVLDFVDACSGFFCAR